LIITVYIVQYHSELHPNKSLYLLVNLNVS